MSMINDSDWIGKQIGNYRVVAELTQGFVSGVYLAQHLLLKHNQVAIKLLHGKSLRSVERQQQFLQEAEKLDLLRHPHIISIIDVGQTDEGFPYMITEYAPGGSLKDRIERYRPGPLPLEESLVILSQIGEAVQYMHQQNIIHCDLKPGNVLFNGKSEVLLADFGSAVLLDVADTRRTAGEGTFYYMAPEQFEGVVSKGIDQYALGCIAYELLTGRQPFTALSIRAVIQKHMMEDPIPPTQLNQELPAHVEQAILKAMAKVPADRHSDVTAFISALHMPLSNQIAVLAGSSTEMTTSAQPDEPEVLPKTRENWLDEAVAHQKTGCYEESLAAYENAIELDSSDAYAYIGKGLMLCKLKRYEEALNSFEHAIELDAGDAYAYISKGLVLSMLKRYEQALDVYDEAIQLDVYDVDAYLGKGLALEHLQRYDEALLVYEQAISYNPNHVSAWRARADLLQKLERTEEAQYALEIINQLEVIVGVGAAQHI